MKKRRKLISIVLTLCMVLMLVPATVFAEGGTTPTYDLWQVDGKVYYAEAGTCTDFSTADEGVELPDWSNSVCYQFPDSVTYVLQTDITLTSSKRMIQFTKSDTTLELNGKTVTSYDGTFSYILADNATIQDSIGGGTINGMVSFGSNCSLTLKSGTISALSITSDSTFYADGGKIGTVNEVYRGTITQNNGTAGTEFNGLVQLAAGTISRGVFYGTVYSGGVAGSCTISGGVFYGEVQNRSESTISGGVFYGGIEDYGGTITDPYHTVSFDLNGASGTAPVTQYFVNTNTAQALEPAAPTREGYEFAGWYTDGELKTPYDFNKAVTDNITLYAGWEEEIITLTVPFTTTVKKGGTVEPPKNTTFYLEFVDSNGNFVDVGGEGTFEGVEVTASVTTNGVGSYPGTMTITGPYEEMRAMLLEGAFVRQTDDGEEYWTYGDTVWGLFMNEETSGGNDDVVAMAVSEDPDADTASKYYPLVYATTYEDGSYDIDWDANPVECMTFTNTYTKSVYVPTYPIGPTVPADPPGDMDTDNPGDADNPGDIEEPADVEEPADTEEPAEDTEAVADDSDETSDTSPKTGDSTDLVPWIALMILSGAGIGGTTLYTRRKRTNE